jgi:hypothetical protein
VLDFLSNTDVGRRVLNPATEEDTQSEAVRVGTPGAERERRGGWLRIWAPGTGGEEQPLFLPTPSFMASAEEE